MRRLRQLPSWIDFIWCALLAIYVLAGITIVPFHGDESTLTYMGRDYFYHFVEGDMTKVLYDEMWSISPTEQQLRLLNGTVPKYSYGWVTAVTGNSFEAINGQWDWTLDYQRNLNSGRIPTDDILIPARAVSAVQLALAITLYFFIARTTFNRPVAYLSSLYLTLNPSILMNGRRAMMEGSHFLGMMLVILAGLWLIQNRKWWHFVLLGTVSGFALASKHPNAIVIALIFFACGTYAIVQSLRDNRAISRSTLQFIGGLFASGLLALVVFYAMNPAWWGAPVQRASEVLRLRNELLELQVGEYDTYFTVTDHINGFLDFIFVAQPQYFEAPQWSLYQPITEQIQIYEASILSGTSIGGSDIGGVILALLVGYGIIRLIRDKAIESAHRWLILVWGIGIVIITFLLTPLGWQRYYLPVYPFIGLMMAYSVHTMTLTLWKRFTV